MKRSYASPETSNAIRRLYGTGRPRGRHAGDARAKAPRRAASLCAHVRALHRPGPRGRGPRARGGAADAPRAHRHRAPARRAGPRDVRTELIARLSERPRTVPRHPGGAVIVRLDEAVIGDLGHPNVDGRLLLEILERHGAVAA